MIHNLRKILQFIMLSFCLSQISYATDKEEILEKNEEKTNISNKIVLHGTIAKSEADIISAI